MTEVDENEDPVVGGDLNLTGAGVNVVDLIILERSVSPGRAAQFSISGQLRTGTPYSVKVRVTTTGGRTKNVLIPVAVV